MTISDDQVRVAALQALDRERDRTGSTTFDRTWLLRGFTLLGVRIPFISPQGIFTPAVLDSPLSILTVPVNDDGERPYDDAFGADGLLRYHYRRGDPNHRDNAGLRDAMRRRLKLIYFHGIVPGRYEAAYPVFVVADNLNAGTFSISVDEYRFASLGTSSDVDDVETQIRRGYVTRQVRQRLHQRAFRERVLAAYERHCAICQLKRDQLLDAAHIIGDAEGHGDPSVKNGIALCKLHHSAFDINILGVTPNGVIEIKEDVLREVDGPMLIHGLQGWNGRRLSLPRQLQLRPDRERLRERYERFLSAP